MNASDQQPPGGVPREPTPAEAPTTEAPAGGEKATTGRGFRLPNPKLALAVLVALTVAGVLLVILGGGTGSAPNTAAPPASTSTTASGATAPVPALGTFPTINALSTAVAALDPATLRPAGAATTTTAPLATATIDRCATVLPHASVDRTVTTRRAVATASVAGRPLLVYSYDADKTAKLPAGIRVFIVDEASCALELAQDH